MADIEAMFYQDLFLRNSEATYAFFGGLTVVSIKSLKSMKCVSIFLVL